MFFSVPRLTAVVLMFVIFFASCQPDEPEASLSGSVAGHVDVFGVALRYETVGEGETCLWLGSAPVYAQLFPEDLLPLLRCTILDSRFWVAAADPDVAFDMPTAVSEVEVARAALGLDQFILVGHSIQGLVAQEYARVHPERVKGVVVIGYGPHSPPSGYAADFWGTDATEERKVSSAFWSARFSADSLGPPSSDWGAFSASYLGRTAAVWFDPDTDPSWLTEVEGGEISLAVLGSFQTSVSEYNVLEQEPAPTRPVFLALGRFDYLIPFTIWEPWRDQVDYLTLHLFEESGHWAHLEEPGLFAERLGSWLAGLN